MKHYFNYKGTEERKVTILLKNDLDKIHTTEMGKERIKKNLKLDAQSDVVDYCKQKISDKNCIIYEQGKNWYCIIDKIQITIHKTSYTIITAHFLK